ncbi:MAG TPA: hypothetical protein VF587_10325 [Solirubrobacteraceae bacterium]
MIDLDQQGATDLAARWRERLQRFEDDADGVIAAVRKELCRGGGMGSAHDFVSARGWAAIDRACAALDATDG